MTWRQATRFLIPCSWIFSILLSVFFFIQTASGQENENFTIKRYTSRKGLPQNSIRAMLRDKDNFLWLATEGGLVRFDGRHFRLFSQISNPEINNNRFIKIFRTFDGEILAMEVTGTIFRIHDGTIELIKEGDPSKLPSVVIHSGPLDIPFLLNSLDGKFPGLEKEDIPPFLINVFPISPEKFVIRTKSGLTLIENGKKKLVVSLPPPVKGEFFRIENRYYFLSATNEFFNIDLNKGEVRKVRFTGALSNTSISSHLLNKNLIWNVNYDDVYLKLQNKLFKLLPGKDLDEISTDLITSQLPSACLVTDAFYDGINNNLFIGTDTKGLYVFHKNPLKTLLYQDPLDSRNNSYYSQCPTDSNTIFTATQREFNITGGFKSTLPLKNISTESLITDKQGRIWFADYRGVLRYDPATGITIQIPTLPENGITCYYEEGDSVFAAGDYGVGYVKDNKYHHLTGTRRISELNMKIETLARGPDNKIWVAMCSGVGILDEKSQEIKMIEPFRNICARSLFVSGNKIFIGSYGQGYFCYENGKITKMPVDKGKSLSHVHSFFIDQKNYLWLSTNQGLFRTRFENILNYLRDTTYNFNYQYFGEEDGIVNTEFNGGCSPSVLRLKNGYVSYPTMDGLVWLIPESIPDHEQKNVIVVDDIILDGIKHETLNEIEVPSNHENIRISFATPFWENPNNLFIQYRLTGFNRAWVDLNPEDQWIEFTNLPSGSYSLEIRKMGITDSKSSLSTILKLSVEKKIYERTWFILFGFVLAIYLFGVALQWNSRRVIRKNQELELKIRDRTNELRQANDKLAQNLSVLEEQEQELRDTMSVKDKMISVISHDIITPLKFISMVSRISKKNPELIDRKKLVESMNDIEFASDKLYNNATNILNWMKFQNKRIIPSSDYLAINEFIEELAEPLRGMAEIQGIRIVNEIPDEEIVRTDKNILMIILQNLLSNAIKYSGADAISFRSKLETGRYIITVADNGVGIPEPTLEQIERIRIGTDYLQGEFRNREEGNHLGYYIIVDFLHMIQGNLTIESSQGKGTSVTIDFPVEAT